MVVLQRNQISRLTAGLKVKQTHELLSRRLDIRSAYTDDLVQLVNDSEMGDLGLVCGVARWK